MLQSCSDLRRQGRGSRNRKGRFGTGALRLVNQKELRPLRLRGVYARVLQPGQVKVGQLIQKTPYKQ